MLEHPDIHKKTKLKLILVFVFVSDRGGKMQQISKFLVLVFVFVHG
jgi:hypothetical protein